jgi:hypothetical protein
VILGFTRCIVRVTRPMGQMPLGMLSRLVRDLLRLPGALGCRPETIDVLRNLAILNEANPAQADQAATRRYDLQRDAVAELLMSLSFEAPLFIFIDDYGEADSVSVELLSDAIAFCRGYRILFVLTHRSGIPLHGDFSDFSCSIELLPLHASAALSLAELVASPTGRRLSKTDAQLVVSASDCTPLSLVSLARERLVAGITGPHHRTIFGLVADQIRRLPWQSRVLLRTIAVMGGSITDLEASRCLGLSLADTQYALLTLIERGLVEQSDVDVISCHQEVARAVLASMSNTELSVLRHDLCIALNTLLESEYSSERVFNVLSLAHESGDVSLLLSVVLRWSSTLSKSTLSKPYLAILERASILAVSAEEKAAIRRLLLLSSQEAAEWRVAVRALSDQNSVTSDRSDQESTEERLARIEGALHAFLGRGGIRLSEEALEIANDTSELLDYRVRAVRLALNAASELLEPSIGALAFASVERLRRLSSDPQRVLAEASMQYDTIFGNLDEAVVEADRFRRQALQLAKTSTGIRQLSNASFVLRIAGHFSEAADCLQSCAASALVSADSSRLLEIKWRRCVLAIEAGDRESAIHLGRQLLDLAEEQDCLEEEWLQLFAMRLEVIEHGHILTALIPNRLAESAPTEPTRAKLYALALSLNATENQRSGVEFRRMLSNAVELLRKYGAFTGMDFLAASASQQLVRIGDDQAAADLLSTYWLTQRRERSKPSFVFSGLDAVMPPEALSPLTDRKARTSKPRPTR